jgi:hypothetical protein
VANEAHVVLRARALAQRGGYRSGSVRSRMGYYSKKRESSVFSLSLSHSRARERERGRKGWRRSRRCALVVGWRARRSVGPVLRVVKDSFKKRGAGKEGKGHTEHDKTVPGGGARALSRSACFLLLSCSKGGYLRAHICGGRGSICGGSSGRERKARFEEAEEAADRPGADDDDPQQPPRRRRGAFLAGGSF